jgi:hypothetical protein
MYYEFIVNLATFRKLAIATIALSKFNFKAIFINNQLIRDLGRPLIAPYVLDERLNTVGS